MVTATPVPADVTATARVGAARTAVAATSVAKVELAATLDALAWNPPSEDELAATEEAQAAALTAWLEEPAVFADSFDSNSEPKGWYFGDNADEYRESSWVLRDGAMVWREKALKDNFNISMEQIFLAYDFAARADIRLADGPEDAIYGLVLRLDNQDRLYFFAVTDLGQYAFFLLDTDWHPITDWIDTDAIRQGEVNSLLAVGNGPVFWFYINDRYVGAAYDDTIGSGSFGWGVGLNARDEATLELNNYELRRRP